MHRPTYAWAGDCQADIQSDLFYDYRTNIDAYPQVAGMEA